MAWWTRRPWRSRASRDREIAEEIRTHLDMAAARHEADGMPVDEARQRAQREFGSVVEVRRLTREVWRAAWTEQLWEDIRFGVRILWTSPAVSLTAVALIALVIGGNTTVYSVARMVLTSPAAGVTSDRLVMIAPAGSVSSDPFISYRDFRDIVASPDLLQRPAAWTTDRLVVTIDGIAHAVSGGVVAGAFFDTLGVRALEGRVLEAADELRAGEGLVAVVSERFWRDRLGQDASAVGLRLLVNGQPTTVVGIAAGGFRGAVLTPGEDIWVPLVPFYRATGHETRLHDRAQPLVLAAAALPNGRSRAAAQVGIGVLAAQLAEQYPDSHRDRRLVVLPYSATAVLPISRMSGAFLALLAAIMVVTVLVVSANVANLMLVRALARQREVALRQAMGATRGRVVRLLLIEGLAVSLVAWAVASAVAWGVARILVRLIGPGPGGGLDGFAPDGTLVLYAMALALLATVAFTTVPGLRTWRQPVLPFLKAGEQPVAGGRSRVMHALVVAQFAFSVLLLTSAGLAYRSLALVESRDVGFETDGLLFVTLRLGAQDATVERAPTPEERARSLARVEQVRERVLAHGSMTAATYLRRLPGAYLNTPTTVARRDGTASLAIRRIVGPDYLSALGVAPLLGRDVSPADTRDRPTVAVINQSLAHTLWPGTSPIGQMIRVGPRDGLEVIGVAPDVFFDGPMHDPRPHYVFVPELQNEGDAPVDLTMLVRHSGSLKDAVTLVGTALGEVDRTLPIVGVATMQERLAQVTQNEQVIMRLLLVFAGLSLLIATLGLYAVAAFHARRRVREFGVRLALGATPGDIGRDVVMTSVRLAGLGAVLGAAASAAVAALAGRQFIGVSPVDLAVYATVGIVLALISIGAAVRPAIGACTVDVVGALRQE